MTFGLTESGFVPKRFDDLKTELQAYFRSIYGNDINLNDDELLGQIISVIADKLSEPWETTLATYNSISPSTANGAILDHVVSLTGIERLEATKGTGEVTFYGTDSTVIPLGTQVGVGENSDAQFVTTEVGTITGGTDEVQDIDFDNVPTGGNWTLTFDGQSTSSLAYNAVASTIQTALNGLSNLSGVTVSGDYSSGFTITFAGSDGKQPQNLIQISANTLTYASGDVDVSVVETTPGVLPNITVEVECLTAGNIPAPAGTVEVLVDSVVGVDSITNLLDVTPGRNTETDPELRLRRLQSLATSGSATVDAITAQILTIDDVRACRVFENDTFSTDASGRPPKSFEAVVLGGENQDIGEIIWQEKPAGIATHGGVTVTVQDTQGYDKSVKFSRPDEIEIYITVTVTTNSNYPSGGDDSVKETLVSYAESNFTIGSDVVLNALYCPVLDIAGVEDATITIGTSAPGNGTSNITIADDEIAVFDTSRITVNS